MIRTYIAGNDGTDRGAAAVRFAHVLARATGASVLEATAGPESSPATSLHATAEHRDAALLVVGATHRGAVQRTVPGSVTARLLHGSPCPVVAVPAGWAADDARIAKIVVAFDEREPAQEALHYAADLAKELGATLEVVSVFEPVLAPYAGGIPPVDDRVNEELRATLKADLAEAVAALPPEVDAHPRLLDGPPALAIEKAAAGADLLVTGSRGLGPLRAVLVGSVSRHLVDHAPCPVLVVPRGAAVPA
ncbi:MAG TPA: universal stress protein [Solirubrobacteraceae bacterium]|nr:universal stress protein [Solirubrobacteraceae bacterium]